MTLRRIGIAVLLLAGFVLAVNLAWYGIPFLRENGAFRYLGAGLVIVLVSETARRIKGTSS